MSLSILADENIPAVEHYFGDGVAVRRVGGRKLQRSHLQGVDVLLVRSVTQVNEALLHDTSVKFVGTATSGVDHIDQDYLRQQAIGFAHAPHGNAATKIMLYSGNILIGQDTDTHSCDRLAENSAQSPRIGMSISQARSESITQAPPE